MNQTRHAMQTFCTWQFSIPKSIEVQYPVSSDKAQIDLLRGYLSLTMHSPIKESMMLLTGVNCRQGDCYETWEAAEAERSPERELRRL